jgi:hypothetical protein
MVLLGNRWYNYSMEASVFGDSKSVYEIMTKIFPGVVFGAFYQERNTKTLKVSKTKFWEDIEKIFNKVNTVSDFIDYLGNYKASGNQKTFEKLFPKNTYHELSYTDLIDNLKKSDELSIFLNDCRIINGNIFKGGLFLYCARILDSKFLKNIISETEINIYKVLTKEYNNDVSNVDKFPCVLFFNCNKEWGNSWKCEYDYDIENDGNMKYRFVWEKDRGEFEQDWDLLDYYRVNNPFELFVHQCQKQYTLVNIGKKQEALSIKDLSSFSKFSQDGFNKIASNFQFFNNGKKHAYNEDFFLRDESSIKELNIFNEIKVEENYDAKFKDILMGIEEKDGAKTMDPKFFIPKNLQQVLVNVKVFSMNKEGLRRLKTGRIQLSIEETKEIFELFYTFASKMEGSSCQNPILAEILYEFDSKRINKYPYKKLEILNKCLPFFEEEDKKKINQLNNKLFSKISLDTPINKNNPEKVVGDFIESDEENVFNKRTIYDENMIEENICKILEDISFLCKKYNLLLKFSLIEKNILNELKKNESIERFYKNQILKPIIKFDSNCSENELKKNYLVSNYLKHDKVLPKTTVYLSFRKLLYELQEKIKNVYIQE